MSTRARFLGVALAVAVLLAAGIAAGVVTTTPSVSAQEATPTPVPATPTPVPATPTPVPPTPVPAKGSLARVAAILGIEEKKLSDAFAQVRAENRQLLLDRRIERAIQRQLVVDQEKAAVAEKLGKAVGERRITEEQKTRILEQWDKGRGFSPRHFGRGYGRSWR